MYLSPKRLTKCFTFLILLRILILIGFTFFSPPFLNWVRHFQCLFTGGEFKGSTVIFGTLGYCVKWTNGTTSCSKPSFGYGLGQFSPFHPLPFVTGLNFLSDDSDINGRRITLVLMVFYLLAFIVAVVSFILGLLAAYRYPSDSYSELMSYRNHFGFTAIASIIEAIFFVGALIVDCVFVATIKSNGSVQGTFTIVATIFIIILLVLYALMPRIRKFFILRWRPIHTTDPNRESIGLESVE